MSEKAIKVSFWTRLLDNAFQKNIYYADNSFEVETISDKLNNIRAYNSVETQQ